MRVPIVAEAVREDDDNETKFEVCEDENEIKRSVKLINFRLSHSERPDGEGNIIRTDAKATLIGNIGIGERVAYDGYVYSVVTAKQTSSKILSAKLKKEVKFVI